jgi:hypothetical protein
MTNPKKLWTVMVYLAGDNDLDKAGRADLQEMKKVGSTKGINVLVQFDSAGHNHETTRYLITRGGTLDRDLIKNLGRQNTGDPEVLKDFMLWGIKNYPAEKVLLVVWNHGNGWSDENVYDVARKDLLLGISRRGLPIASGQRAISFGHLKSGSRNFHRALFRTSVRAALSVKGIAYDDNAKDFLDNIELKRVMATAKRGLGRKIDILGMDACLMSMAEVGYQLRDSVKLMVGSEEIEPEDGWPYDRILGALVEDPSMEPEKLAKIIVDKYAASYKSEDGITQSACDLGHSDILAAAVDRLAGKLIKNLVRLQVRAAVYHARRGVQVYDEDKTDYVDFFDFCRLLKKDCDVQDIKAGCDEAMKAVDRFVVRSAFKGPDMKDSHGLSIYFPLKNLSSLYGRLDFTKKTKWQEFLKAL